MYKVGCISFFVSRDIIGFLLPTFSLDRDRNCLYTSLALLGNIHKNLRALVTENTQQLGCIFITPTYLNLINFAIKNYEDHSRGASLPISPCITRDATSPTLPGSSRGARVTELASGTGCD